MVTSRLALTVSSVVLGAAAFCASAAAEQTNAPQAEKTAVKTEIVARGLANPWALQFLPDGRYLVTEKPGRLRIVSKDGKISEPISGVPAVADQGQGGLLDVVLAPDFAQSGRIFFSFSEPREDGKNGTSVARAKLVLDGESGRLEDVSVIFRQEPAYKSSAHFGSRIVINADGSLFVTMGDRYVLRAEAQNPANHIGKVIHITADGAPAADNPKLPGWDAKVWSIGHRNIQGAALDPQTGKLWTIEHGAKGGDELNHPEAGKNYGWPVISYGVDYSGAKLGEGRSEGGHGAAGLLLGSLDRRIRPHILHRRSVSQLEGQSAGRVAQGRACAAARDEGRRGRSAREARRRSRRAHPRRASGA